MSPIVGLIVFVALAGAVVFGIGIITRKWKMMLCGAPAVLLLSFWLIEASIPPNPQSEFERIFGVENRPVSSEIQTWKPSFMDGHFLSFRVHSTDFDKRIRPMFTQRNLQPWTFLKGQTLPRGWPGAIQAAHSSFYRDLAGSDIHLLYFPSEEKAYVSVWYEQW